MRLDYTEFSFGYAFTENLIRSSANAPKSAPVFPNLIQEATLGYDVKINLPGAPLFLQYKLPELMKRRTAIEVATYQLSGLSVPFFRMPLMRRNRSEQHQRLIEWEQKFPQTVFYVSPRLHTLREFDVAYNSGRVHESSAFFSPGEIGPLPDDKDHSIAYQANSAIAYFCSEPHEIDAMDYTSVIERIPQLFARHEYSTLENAARDVRSRVRGLVSSQMRVGEDALAQRIRSRRVRGAAAIDPESEQVTEDILVAREMVRVDLGVDLLIAQPRS